MTETDIASLPASVLAKLSEPYRLIARLSAHMPLERACSLTFDDGSHSSEISATHRLTNACSRLPLPPP